VRVNLSGNKMDLGPAFATENRFKTNGQQISKRRGVAPGSEHSCSGPMASWFVWGRMKQLGSHHDKPRI
jgi:hypothetical protein